MIPVKDLNRPLRAPHVNRMLLLANVAVFVATCAYVLTDKRFPIGTLGGLPMVPRDIILMRFDRFYTLLTSMFLHAGFFHLLGNMLYLYIFGDNVEDVFGHVGYFVFYIVCGFAASFAHVMSVMANVKLQRVPVVGASGAISGVLGAYLILHPRARVLTVVCLGLPTLAQVPAFAFLGLWFVMQWVLGMFDIFLGGLSGVAYWAHVGGFITGMILASVFGLRRKRILEATLGSARQMSSFSAQTGTATSSPNI